MRIIPFGGQLIPFPSSHGSGNRDDEFTRGEKIIIALVISAIVIAIIMLFWAFWVVK